MPGTICAVASCKNSLRNSKTSNIMYHRFPKDEIICKTWANFTKRADKFNFKTSRMCSAHFRAVDYERDLEHELLGK